MDGSIAIGDLLLTVATVSITIAIPLILASIGEAFSERAGVLNIGLEGYMLMGAFGAYATTFYSGDPWLGLFGGILAGTMLSMVHAYLSVTIGASQLVSGIAINIAALGLTGFGYRRVVAGYVLPPSITPLQITEIPFLSNIPVLGRILFERNAVVYVVFCLVPLAAFVLNNTTWGLRIRGTGEGPLVVDTAGVNVFLVRYLSIALCGSLAGLGGAFVTVGYLSLFMENVIAGRGFIALAIVIVGGWNPYKILAIALLFGFMDSLQLKLQVIGIGIPFPFLMLLPYLLTIVVLVAFRKMSVPAALCMPYKKKGK